MYINVSSYLYATMRLLVLRYHIVHKSMSMKNAKSVAIYFVLIVPVKINML